MSDSKLVKIEQLPLFRKDQRKRELIHTIDSINDRYGEFTITRGRLLEPTTGSGVISPSWRPSGVKRIEY